MVTLTEALVLFCLTVLKRGLKASGVEMPSGPRTTLATLAFESEQWEPGVGILHRERGHGSMCARQARVSFAPASVGITLQVILPHVSSWRVTFARLRESRCLGADNATRGPSRVECRIKLTRCGSISLPPLALCFFCFALLHGGLPIHAFSYIFISLFLYLSIIRLRPRFFESLAHGAERELDAIQGGQEIPDTHQIHQQRPQRQLQEGRVYSQVT